MREEKRRLRPRDRTPRGGHAQSALIAGDKAKASEPGGGDGIIELRKKAMSKRLPRKAVIAVSSFNGAIYAGGHKTGVFFVEALYPYEVLTAAGFE